MRMFLHILLNRQNAFPSTISYNVSSCPLRVRVWFSWVYSPPTPKEEVSKNVVPGLVEAAGGGKKGVIGNHKTYVPNIPALTNKIHVSVTIGILACFLIAVQHVLQLNFC